MFKKVENRNGKKLVFHRPDKGFVNVLQLQILFEYFVIVLHHVVFQNGNAAEQIFKHLFVDVGELIMAERVFVPPFLNHMRRNTDCGTVVGNFPHNDRIGADFAVGTDRDVAEHFGSRPDDDPAFDRRMAFARGETHSSERYTLINQNVIFDDRCLADDDAEAVVDKNPSSDRCTRMDVDIGKNLVDPHDDTGEGLEAASIKTVGDTVPKNGPDPRIVEEKFDSRTDGGIIFINVRKIFGNF